jgi:hypothetical protein
VGRTLLIAGLCALIPLGGNVVASFVTEWSGGRAWLVVPAVGVGVAMLTALVQAYGSAGRSAPEPDVRSPDRRPGDAVPYRRYGPAKRRGTPLPVALVVAVLVIGVGGYAVTQGVRYAVGYVTGNEPGTERLLEPASASAGGLTLTVESVKHTAHFTRVRIAARNDSEVPLTLPLFKNCLLVSDSGDGTTLEAEPFKSRWSEQLAPGSLQRGTITFDGHLPDTARRASFSFITIFAFGPGGPRSIKVSEIRLGPP